MRENVERIASSVFTEALTIKVDRDTKRRILALRNDKRVNTSAEFRKALLVLIKRLEEIA